jgi:hypothetical protein
MTGDKYKTKIDFKPPPLTRQGRRRKGCRKWKNSIMMDRKKQKIKENVMLVNHALLKNRVDSASNKNKDL